MAAEEVRYERCGPVAVLTLDRARYHNAQSWKLLDDLDRQLDRAMADEDVRVVVLKGDGRHFSSGHDLGTPEQQADIEARGLTQWVGMEWYEAFRWYNLDNTVKWRNLPKPTIAMVHGYCIFGGWMIAAAMDLIFAAPSARFLASLFETFTVPWDIHPRKAKELLFESRFIDAEEARELGLVNRVYTEDELERETMAYAERIAENDPAVLRLGKLAVNKAQDAMGYSANVEAAFADYLVVREIRGSSSRVDGNRRLVGVDLALRGQRGGRAGQTPAGETDASEAREDA